jgi:hypothetical protein
MSILWLQYEHTAPKDRKRGVFISAPPFPPCFKVMNTTPTDIIMDDNFCNNTIDLLLLHTLLFPKSIIPKKTATREDFKSSAIKCNLFIH